MEARVSGAGWRLPFGATVVEGGVSFRVWAPGAGRLEVILYEDGVQRAVAMRAEPEGWFSASVPGAGAGSRYRFRLDGGDAFPDPASRGQPEGVHGPSEVVDPAAFRWTDGGWRGVAMEEMVVYEVHVGTATEAGTFDALIERLDHVVSLGATAVELMPVAAFPGQRNWGYDGVDLFAPAAPYGGPEGLRRFVDAAHARGVAVLLDVVYNHLGPEGNYLPAFTGGRYFTDRHRTPWGDAVNVDGSGSAAVREFIVGNALHWAHEYHVDGLRLDATHAIVDDSPVHLLAELAARVRGSLPPERRFVVIAEDERNERSLVLPPEAGGYGLDGVWADDFHHAVRRLTAGDHEGYFADFEGTAGEVAETLRRGWRFEGQHAPSHGGARGTPAAGVPPAAFVHCIQNHDQVGNRAMGDRITETVPLPVYRAASALLLLSPYTPLLWMGQEWAASTPFRYFTDHPEPLGSRVTEGRREEFGRFSAFSDPAVRERIPDPQAESTFLASKLVWEELDRQPHAGVLALYRALLALRRTHPALARRGRDSFAVTAVGDGGLALRRTGAGGEALLLLVSFGRALRVDLGAREETRPPAGAAWRLLLSSEEARFGGALEGEVAALTAEGVLGMPGAGAVVLESGG
jgi:maltooligosyltrehalose trehalohydrolase